MSGTQRMRSDSNTARTTATGSVTQHSPVQEPNRGRVLDSEDRVADFSAKEFLQGLAVGLLLGFLVALLILI